MSTHRHSLALSRDLLHWLRQSPGWPALPWRTRASSAWLASMGSLNASLSQAQLKGAPALAAPLFIVGPWRSGTTVMHELLSAATGLPTPLTWQCMNAAAFQLSGKPPAHTTIARPMDGLEIGALSPQEDEFALLTLGVNSAYRAFLMPERLPELARTLDQAYWADSAAQWLPRMEAFLQGVLHSLQRTGQRLILKSPNHTFRLRALLRRFPDAKLVWMSRDPLATFLSNRKMWRAMFAQHALGARCPDEQLDRFLGQALQASANMLEELLLAGLPPHTLAVCSQEALQTDPQGALQVVMDRLQLPAKPQADALHRALERTRRGRIERYTQAAPAEVADSLAALQAAQQLAARWAAS